MSPPQNSCESAEPAAGEFVRYVTASLVALLLDIAVLQSAVAVVHYLVAASLGFIIGATANYLLSTRWVFRTRRLAEHPPIEFSAFFLIGLAGLAINDLIIFLSVSQFGLALLASKLVAAGATFLFNYTARKLALF